MQNASAENQSVSPSLQFRRVRTCHILALLALALALFALSSPLIPALAEDTSLHIPSITGSILLLTALVLLRALCMFTIAAHCFVMVLVLGLTQFAVSEFLALQFIVPVSIITALAAIYAYFYEQGLMVDLSNSSELPDRCMRTFKPTNPCNWTGRSAACISME